MGGYSDINRGPQLALEYEALQEWRRLTAAQKQQRYRTVAEPAADRVKTERIPGYVLPFASTNNSTYFITRARETAIRIPKYRFAKITASARKGEGNDNAESRFTGRPYKRYRSDSVSSPFGKGAATDSYYDLINEMMSAAQYRTFVATTGNRIGFTPEG